MDVYKTQVNIDLSVLRKVVSSLKSDYDLIGNRETTKGRSKFCSWNNVNKFLERLNASDSDSNIMIDVVGESKGGTKRVYNRPSVTSLSMPFRECIVPKKEGNVFAFFDIKAAEFFMNCVFCGMGDAYSAYKRGEDIYMHFKDIFPVDCSRDKIKESLISFMYGVTPYTVAKKLGISEGQAGVLLSCVARNLPQIQKKKMEVIAEARRKQQYFCPDGFDQVNKVFVADVDDRGFSENRALSTYVQSALGVFMQKQIHELEKRTRGTLLSVFDSIVVEINPDSKERFEKYVKIAFSPFEIGKIGYGNSFLEALKNSK